MGLFKSNTDPSPGGGKSAGGPDPLAKVIDPRLAGATTPADRSSELDLTRIMMQGVACFARIDALRDAHQQINLQETFVVDLTVHPEEGEAYSVRVTQAVAEDYLGRVVKGALVKVKCDPDDPELVWIDWAASSDL
ncbi:MAG: hypothetical protein QM648_05650 [Solirubrobacterales bacterium]